MAMLSNTIVALATPAGKSGVAVIRISGPQARYVLAQLLGTVPAPRVATLGWLKNPTHSTLIDQALTLWFPAPNSFTGEDVVEFHIHGSLAVIEEILTVCTSFEQVRMAEAGEFTRRAFYSGKMDLTAIEGLSDIINAETAAQKKLALHQLQGHLADFYTTMRNRIIKALALIEAWLDFPDEDLPAAVTSDIITEVDALLKDIDTLLQDSHNGERIREGITIVLAGAPNAGKSSLLNRLAKRDAAIVSEFAGTTRDVIEVRMDLGGYAATLIDTAGLRESNDIIESEGIKRARNALTHADITIVLHDASTLPTIHSDSVALHGPNALIVINKADQLSHTLPQKLSGAIIISVTEDSGIDKLMDILQKRIRTLITNESPLITRQRHRQHLMEAQEALKSYKNQKDEVLMAEQLRLAASAIGKITGKIEIDAILDHIFSSFCIGK